MRTLLFSASIVMLSGCGDDMTLKQVCYDWADAVAQSSEACITHTYYTALRQSVKIMNGCNIKSVRDIEGLYDRCLPFLKRVQCQRGKKLPSECIDQFAL